MKYKATITFEADDNMSLAEVTLQAESDLRSGELFVKNQVYGYLHIQHIELNSVQSMEETKLFCPYCGGRAEVVASPPTSYAHHPWFCVCKECKKEFTLNDKEN